MNAASRIALPDFPTLTAVLAAPLAPAAVLAQALALARGQGSHLDVLCLGAEPPRAAFAAGDISAEALHASLARSRREAEELAALARKKLDGLESCVVPLPGGLAGIDRTLGQNGRYSDLVICARAEAEPAASLSRRIVEEALFVARSAVLAVPEKTRKPSAARRVLVAWNGSDEALNAIRRALPLLRGAEIVELVVIDPPVDSPERSDPGGEISLFLSRHGVSNTINVLGAQGRDVSAVLNEQVRRMNADLVVMGAYGRTRYRAGVLGGTTRHMLTSAKVPLFMCR